MGSIRPGVFAPTYVKYTPKPSNVYFFFSFIRATTDEPVAPIVALNMSYGYDVVLRKEVSWGENGLDCAMFYIPSNTV